MCWAVSVLRVGFWVLACWAGLVGGLQQHAWAQEDPGSVEQLSRSFENPPPEARVMMRWWWFGPSITRDEVERELQTMLKGGIGGFEVQPVYPLENDDPTKQFKNWPFLSSEFFDVLRYTARRARELELRYDLTLGSGWPYGGPQIPVSQAAGMLRVEKIQLKGPGRYALPSLSFGEKFIGAYAVLTTASGTPQVLAEIELGSDPFVRIGSNLAEKANELWVLIASRTGMMVKRAAYGAEGFVLDHYSREALETYLKEVGKPLLAATEPDRPYAIFCDSLEVYRSNWTDDLLEEFRKRRGYDLKPHLPNVLATRGGDADALRRDWMLTLSELYEERFLQPLAEWAERSGTKLRIQSYGEPPARLSSYRHAHLFEGEGWHWQELSSTRWASSAAHILGKKVVSSETWTWLHSPVFRATPLDMKAEADLHFLEGINQLIGHGWPYTPSQVSYPGWRFYAAAVFNDKNPWWLVMPDISKYLQRLSYLLRLGAPVVDVAIYLPTDDALATLDPYSPDLYRRLRSLIGRELLPALARAGLNADFFDDVFLKEFGQSRDGQLILGSMAYKLVVLPPMDTIPLATLQRLASFAAQGGRLIALGRLPDRAPGFKATQAEHEGVRKLARQLFLEAGAQGKFFEQPDESFVEWLRQELKPDLSWVPAHAKLGFVHRAGDQWDIYFLVNTEPRAQSLKISFRANRKFAELWDPVSGKQYRLLPLDQSSGHPQFQLELAPYQSVVIVLSDAHRQLPRLPAYQRDRSLATVDLSKDWKLHVPSFERTIPMQQLRPWTEYEELRFFSGVATYEKTFELAGTALQSGVRWLLSFGEGELYEVEHPRANSFFARYIPPVREAAVVWLNGQRVGALWTAPYWIDVTGFLRPGVNQLKIEVANLAVNYLAGTKLPDYRLLYLRYGRRFDPQEMDRIKVEPSGILKPVQLIPCRLANQEASHE